ncbi:hypothetical protein [Lysobacter claricitrinus]|uniref:hypothetical protein n=1 Tax=Lysobacter claricitrinus TaxID=3367728 RepID=UPI0037DBA6DD
MENQDAKKALDNEQGRPNRVFAPADLPDHLLSIWVTEFERVPVGHFVQSDRGAMIDLCRLIDEAANAQAAMVANRNRDTTAHWRACMALCQSARRALRMLPHSRQSPRRAGALAQGSARDDGTAYDPPARGSHDWRELFTGNVMDAPARDSHRAPRRRAT